MSLSHDQRALHNSIDPRRVQSGRWVKKKKILPPLDLVASTSRWIKLRGKYIHIDEVEVALGMVSDANTRLRIYDSGVVSYTVISTVFQPFFRDNFNDLKFRRNSRWLQ